MLPANFVVLDHLPLTSHGKVDRRALPQPEVAATPTAEFIAPQTPMEKLAAGIWTEVLQVPRVGARDDFFMLGGHSLLATLAVSRAETLLGQHIPLRSLFDNHVVDDWARTQETGAAKLTDSAPPIRRADRTPYRRAVPAPTD
jgi:hypothetical protein